MATSIDENNEDRGEISVGFYDTHYQNRQQNQFSTTLLFGPFKSLFIDLMNQNRQLRAEMDHLKKQTQSQNDILVKQLEIISDLRCEINELKGVSSKHGKHIDKLQAADQTQSAQIHNINQRHNLLETNVKYLRSVVKYRLVNKCKQQGIIVAGGNGCGSQLNQLSNPQWIFIDDNQTIYIADTDNHRIVEWKSNTQNGRIVAGGNGQGKQMNQLNQPTDVIIDKATNSLVIADRGNRRVIRCSRESNTINGKILIEDIDCGGLTMDKNGFLYVSDELKNEVRRWKSGEKEGTIVADGNGSGDQLNQFNGPFSIFVDENDSLYVSDWNNHRVMKWNKDAKQGTIVAGGNGKGNSLKQLSGPEGVIVDELGQIYVADLENNRVMCWYEGDEEGRIVVDRNDEGKQSNQLSCPAGLSFDIEGNLYVVDCANDRVEKFEIDLNFL